MSRVVSFFKNHFLLCDTIVVILVFYVVNIAMDQAGWKDLPTFVLNNATTLFPIFFTAGITLLGFLLTGVSVLLAFIDKSRLERLKDKGHFKSIFNIFFNALLFCGIFVFLGLWGLLDPGQLACHLISLTIFLLATRIWRCVWIFEALASITYKNN